MMESPKGHVDEKASVSVKGMESAEKRSVIASWTMNTFLNTKSTYYNFLKVLSHKFRIA